MDLFNQDNEVAVLSLILINPDLVFSVNSLKPFMFSASPNQVIFSGIVALEEQGLIPEFNLLVNYLIGKDKLKEAGTQEYLNFLKNQNYKRENLSAFVDSVINAYKARTMISSTADMAKKINEGNVEQVISNLRHTIDTLEETSGGEQTVDMLSATRDTWEEIKGRIDNPGIRGISTGLKDLDMVTGGFIGTNYWIIASRPSMGKEQPLYSKVYTVKGIKTMGEISLGDEVIGADGNGHSVIGVYPQGIKPIYRVYFDDETYADCGLDHLWLTESRKERKNKSGPSVKTLKEIIDSGIKLPNGNNYRNNHSICLNSPVNFSKKEIPIRPYLLGVLLGDGGFTDGCISITTKDQEIIDQVVKELPKEDKLSKEFNKSISYNIVKSYKQYGQESTKTKEHLRSLGLVGLLSDQKFIPEDYLFSSVEDRLDILSGLFDTDAYVVNKNFIEYSTTSKELRDGVMSLVRSLGGKCNFIKRIGQYKKNGILYKTKEYYRVFVSFNNGLIPFKLNRKSKLLASSKRTHKKYISNVEFIGNFEAQCIYLDSKDHLYLTDNFVVTHNSASLVNMAMSIAENNKPTLVFSLEMNKESLVERMLAIKTGIPITDIRLGLLNQAQLNKITEAIKELKDLPIYIDSNFNASIEYILQTIRRYKKLYNVKVVFIDYVQLLAEREADQTAELGRISRGLKLLGNELNITVVLFSQLSRSVEERDDKRPILKDLRQSGNLEEDADIVIFLYRDEYYNRDTKSKGVVEWIIRKHRQGAIGSLFFDFEADTNKIKEQGGKRG